MRYIERLLMPLPKILQPQPKESTVTRIAEGLEHLLIAVDDLELLEGNPRRGNVDAVVRSLDRFGQRKPIVFREADGVKTVVAGNHTLMAVRQLGWDTIAAVAANDLTDDEATAYAIADNRTQDLGTYDDELLAGMVQRINDSDKELLYAAGYDDESLKDLLALVEPPDLDDLIDEVGDPDDPSAFWPSIGVKVAPDVFNAWNDAMASMGDTPDSEKVRAIVGTYAAAM
jgi:hypothetical protein